MKRMSLLLCALAVSGGVTVLAQSSETQVKSKITVKEGKSATLTGCVMQSSSGPTNFMLTHVADKKGSVHDYHLVAQDGELSKHVGHRVLIDGKVTDRGDAKVKVERTEKTKVENGDDKKTTGEAELKGDIDDMPYLGVKSLKMIAAVCP
jgi:hypothetical protein